MLLCAGQAAVVLLPRQPSRRRADLAVVPRPARRARRPDGQRTRAVSSIRPRRHRACSPTGSASTSTPMATSASIGTRSLASSKTPSGRSRRRRSSTSSTTADGRRSSSAPTDNRSRFRWRDEEGGVSRTRARRVRLVPRCRAASGRRPVHQPASWGQIAQISSAGAVAGTQHDVVDVVRSRGGPGRTGSLLVDSMSQADDWVTAAATSSTRT